MTRDDVLAICLDLPAAAETYPFGEEVAVIKVGGKMFALVPLSEEPGSVNLKCDPARAIGLRKAYAGIRPGWQVLAAGLAVVLIDAVRARWTSRKLRPVAAE